MKEKHLNIIRIPALKIQTPIGSMLAGASSNGICFLEFEHEEEEIESEIQARAARFAKFNIQLTSEKNSFLDQLKNELKDYFAGTLKSFSIPVDLQGCFRATAFQISVWNELVKIPFGETRSYSDIAEAIGKPKAIRAVGSANGRNPVAIVIPCHRVINKSGDLGGYTGGVHRKKYLLNLEIGGRLD